MAENFPPIQNILDEIYIKDFHKEIEELDEDTQYKLNIEENVEINTFRKAILKFYEDNKEIINGPYSAKIEELKGMIKRLQSEFKDKIIQIRLKYIKHKETDLSIFEPVSTTGIAGIVKKYAYQQKDPLERRIRMGDDLTRDIQRLSKEEQQIVQDEIDELYLISQENIKRVIDEKTAQREEVWKNIAPNGKPYTYEQKKTRLDDIDREEEMMIHKLKEKWNYTCITVREKMLKSKQTQLEGTETKYKTETETEPEPEETKYETEVKNIDIDKLFIPSIINEKITIPFNKMSNNMTRYFESYAEKRIEGKCRNEGYIRLKSSNVISYSTGLLFSDKVIYDVVYSVEVCYPYENMEIDCKIKNITKIGIRAVISETNNPIILFISREHNPDKEFDNYKENQIIKVKVIGQRFELNDEYISVIGELI